MSADTCSDCGNRICVCDYYEPPTVAPGASASAGVPEQDTEPVEWLTEYIACWLWEDQTGDSWENASQKAKANYLDGARRMLRAIPVLYRHPPASVDVDALVNEIVKDYLHSWEYFNEHNRLVEILRRHGIGRETE